MKKTEQHIIITLAAVSVIFIAACSSSDVSKTDSGISGLASYRALWTELSQSGEYDSLISVTVPFYKRSEQAGDTLSAVYAGVFLAQSWLFKENTDSVRYWMDRVSWYVESVSDPAVMTVYENVQGSYALKAGLDYPQALEHYVKALEWAEKAGNINNRIVILSNIVQIFYIRGDSHGMDYADSAFRLSLEDDAGSFSKCLALMNMGQMKCLDGDSARAMEYALKAERTAVQEDYRPLYSLIWLLKADISSAGGNRDDAESAYKEAMRWSEYTDPGTMTLVCLEYGRHFVRHGDYRRASELYSEGLRLSSRHGNMEFRRDILRALSDVSLSMGDVAGAAAWFDTYRSHVDSIANVRKEQEFNNLLLQYQRMEYEHEIQSRELELMKADRKMMVAVFIIVIIAVVSVLSWTLYVRQRRLYRLLVSRHQSYIEQLKMEAEAGSPSPAEAEPGDNAGDREAYRQLFLKVEDLMRNEKVFRKKDLTRDNVSEMLGTNRTYLSKAINTFSGKSFNNYINTYRINEAVSIISGPSGDIPVKQLAEDLGFGSVSVFYKVFQRETGLSISRYKKELAAVRSENNRNVQQFDEQ